MARKGRTTPLSELTMEFAQRHGHPDLQKAAVASALKGLFGEAVARHIEIIDIRKGTLLMRIQDAHWHEMFKMNPGKVMEKLRTKIPFIHKLTIVD